MFTRRLTISLLGILAGIKQFLSSSASPISVSVSPLAFGRNDRQAGQHFADVYILLDPMMKVSIVQHFRQLVAVEFRRAAHSTPTAYRECFATRACALVCLPTSPPKDIATKVGCVLNDMGVGGILEIEPGQPGCVYDDQCSAVWPEAKCDMAGVGTCRCGEFKVEKATRDGHICLDIRDISGNALAITCPLPEGAGLAAANSLLI